MYSTLTGLLKNTVTLTKANDPEGNVAMGSFSISNREVKSIAIMAIGTGSLGDMLLTGLEIEFTIGSTVYPIRAAITMYKSADAGVTLVFQGAYGETAAPPAMVPLVSSITPSDSHVFLISIDFPDSVVGDFTVSLVSSSVDNIECTYLATYSAR